MKKTRNYTLLALAIPICIVTLFNPPFACKSDVKQTKRVSIIKSTTDDRGLTSVVYTDGKDTFALDYLTPDELRGLKNK